MAAKTLQASEKDLAKAKADLTVAIRERDSASAGLVSAQKQAKDQTKRLLEAEDQLRIAKELVKDLSKKLAAVEHDKGVAEYARDEAIRAKQEAEFARNEAEAAKETAEDDGYNAGVVETQAILKAQIPRVCRLYCSQIWEEALKRAGVNASSDLWKAENIFYPTAIREATSSSSVAMSDQPEEGVTQSENLQMPNAEERAILAQPPQAIPLAAVLKSTNTNPVQPSPEGTILQGVETDPVPPSQDVADAKLKK
ncbi:uncharacterized protein LOC115959532 [Quercus lobata]|uniref:uncharacterized protein LOC115959532 n=1 Tax=Quercus lobata TaxID=97700 RepID=UPI001245DCAA|nr:uncharacterized protein LOC115959532 [Quercus lobata]